VINMMATNLLDAIILASSIFSCTELHAILRLAQNAFSLGAVGDASSPCPLCEAPSAARLSHLVRCGALWLFLDEECPGLGWDCSLHLRWQFLFGSQVRDSCSAALLALTWDVIYAGTQAGRFGQDGLAGCMSRMRALCCRPGQSAQLTRLLMQPPPDV
jgi:hypothetical protein